MALIGCDRCGPSAIAELVAATGDVSADDASEPLDFAPAAVGRRFVVGDAVRTSTLATADLALAGGGSLHVDPESIVRFSRSAEIPRLEVEAGTTTIEASATAPLEIETVFGTTRLDAATSARLGPGRADGVRFEIVFGHATLEPADGGERIEVAVGESVDGSGGVPRLAVAVAPPRETGASDVVAPAVEATPTRTIEVGGADGSVRAPGSAEFVPLEVGSREVPEGAVVRGAAETMLHFPTSDGSVRVAGASEVRLAPGSLELVQGSAEAEGGAATRIELPGGVLVLAGAAGSSSARVEVRADGSGSVAVLAGSARHEAGGSTVTLAAPDTLDLAPGGASAATGDDAAADGATAGASAGADGPASVICAAGESIVVHDPSGGARLRFEAASDCGEASWRFEGRGHPPNATSSSPVVVSLRPGTVRYRVECSGGGEASGSVRVDRDSGRAVVPRTAPRTVVDADGRPYSVLYQSLLPEIVLRWPRAPAGGHYEIEVHRGGATRRVSTSSPTHTFASGELSEGTHTLTFRASDGSSSPATSVRIRFDNATPVATIRSPIPSDPLGAMTRVEGIAAEGASVSVGGVAIPVLDGGRFEGDVPVPAGGCISIRVAAPGRGVHHHVRCGD